MIAARSPSSPSQPPAQDAFQRALRYLGHRPRSEAELRSHLRQRGYDDHAIDRSVARLRELNYLNDGNFARSWTAAKVTSRGYGPKRIENELRTKGIKPAVIRDAVVEAFSAGEEKRNAKRLIARHYRNLDLKDAKQLQRAAAFLLRRGYSSQVIYEVLKFSLEAD
ncbi:MAG: regulatory protein RecX [Deltaproteobacteria bacterium]|nr:regulatory protein RecX [Deltaproteobacteria bacterium]